MISIRKILRLDFFFLRIIGEKVLLLRLLKLQHPTLSGIRNCKIYAEVFSDNTGSQRALVKAGFKLEATLKNNIIKNDVIKDSCIYSVLKEDFKP